MNTTPILTNFGPNQTNIEYFSFYPALHGVETSHFMPPSL